MTRRILSALALLGLVAGAATTASADLVNAECWAYYIEVYTAEHTLEEDFYGSYCWTSNPHAFVWRLTPASEEQHAVLAAAHAAGAPEIEHHHERVTLEDGRYYLLDGYRIQESL